MLLSRPAATDLPQAPGHPFDIRLNQVLAETNFDEWLEDLCRPYYFESRDAVMERYRLSEALPPESSPSLLRLALALDA